MRMERARNRKGGLLIWNVLAIVWAMSIAQWCTYRRFSHCPKEAVSHDADLRVAKLLRVLALAKLFNVASCKDEMCEIM